MSVFIRVCLAMHSWLFKDIHVEKLEALAILAIDPLKLNNARNAFLINPNILSYCCSLNIYEYSKHHQQQYF